MLMSILRIATMVLLGASITSNSRFVSVAAAVGALAYITLLQSMLK